jgi:ATP-dependent 26S proteasome regulatory subunit
MLSHIQKNIVFSLIILCSGLPSLKAMDLDVKNSKQKSYPTVQAVSTIAQHFAFISYNLISKTVKNKAENASLSKKAQLIVKEVEHSYLPVINQTRSLLYSNTPAPQEALTVFGNYVLGLCRKFGVTNKYFMRFPEKIDISLPIERQVATLKDAVTALEKRFNSIKPLEPYALRLKKFLFYNFISTKIAPKLISFGVGPALAVLWGTIIAANYSHEMYSHPHRQIGSEYKEVVHNRDDQVYIQSPSFMGRLNGEQPREVRDNPCKQPYSANICNGEHTANQQSSANQRGYNQQWDNYDPQWAPRCSGNNCERRCYRYVGFKSPLKIAGELAWAARPAMLLPLFYALGNVAEEAQLPEYENRIKEKQKIEQEKKVQQEMRRMKINYEKNIGFDQIKGQHDLIEREMKMLVDYLRNPFRYHNGASGTRSVLMYGPPGTGKTLLARAVAKESGAPFIEVSADDMFSENSKEKVLAIIRMAEEAASKRPEKSAIIYIDEIDAVTGNRQNGVLDPQRSKALSNLLTIFDGIEKRNPFIHILIIITTNHYKNLDPALLRPGRIDRKLLIAQPNAEGRREFFESFLPNEHKKYMNWLIKETTGYSGAQIVNIIDTAQMIASYNGRTIADEQDYKAALQNSKVELEAIPDAAKLE